MSNRYHVNPETGEAKPCSAEIQCRFGGDAPHFDTKEEAQGAAENMMAEKYGSTTALKKKGDDEQPRYQGDQSEQWLEEARESREALQEAVMKDAIEKNMALVSAYHAEMKKPDKHSFKKPLRELAKIATAEYNKREAGKISYQDVLWYISSKNL